jgi:hypothetical protein
MTMTSHFFSSGLTKFDDAVNEERVLAQSVRPVHEIRNSNRPHKPNPQPSLEHATLENDQNLTPGVKNDQNLTPGVTIDKYAILYAGIATFVVMELFQLGGYSIVG